MPAASTNIPAGVHHFLNERLDGAPIGVVGKAELVTDAIHHALLELSRIEIAPAKPALPASASTSTVIVLCQKTASTQAEGSRDAPDY